MCWNGIKKNTMRNPPKLDMNPKYFVTKSEINNEQKKTHCVGLVTCHWKLLIAAYIPAGTCSISGNLESWGKGGYTLI